MSDDNGMGSMLISTMIILSEGNIVKLVLDARYLNSITDLTSYSWPLEQVGTLLNRVNGKYFTTSELCSANNHPVLLLAKSNTFSSVVFMIFVVCQASSVEQWQFISRPWLEITKQLIISMLLQSKL